MVLISSAGLLLGIPGCILLVDSSAVCSSNSDCQTGLCNVDAGICVALATTSPSSASTRSSTASFSSGVVSGTLGLQGFLPRPG